MIVCQLYCSKVVDMRVLSVDWDYFIDASAEYRVTCFPDGIEKNDFLDSWVWATRYLEEESLRDIGIREKEYQEVSGKAAIWGSRSRVIAFCESHREILYYIRKYIFNQELEIYNVDFHSDSYPNPEEDCGSWFRVLDRGFPNPGNKYVWVAWEGESEVLSWQDWKATGRKEIVNSLNKIPDQSWDLLFVCRSNSWSPPHLDNQFTKFCTKILSNRGLKDVYATPGILDGRMAGVNAQIEQLTPAYQSFRKKWIK